MKSASDLMNLPFDIFTRNSLIAKLVDFIRKNDENTLKILDVGGRAGNLSDFLPDDELHILDIRIGEESNYVLGDVTNSPYRDDSFDVVISSDAYEHIPNNKRLDAIAEMFRISNNFIILGAPFDSKDVREAEIRACNYFNEIAGEPHPWLKEHIDNGLPSREDLEYFLVSNGFEFLTIGTNNISNWLLMQLFMFYSSKYGVPNENMGNIYRYYNDNLLSLGDSLSPTYRTIYLMGKKGTLPKVDFRYNSTMDLSKYHVLETLIFETIGQLTDSRDIHIRNLETLIDEKNRKLNDIYSSTTWQILAKYQQWIDIFLPHTTKRRHMYDLGIIRIRIIVNDGLNAFLYQFKEKLRGSALNASKIALLETTLNPPHAPLSLAKSQCGKFTFPINNLNEIGILTTTCNRKNSDLELHIINTEGQIIRKSSVKGYSIQENEYTSFKFKPINDSKEQTFIFKLSSKGEPSAAVCHNESVTFPELSLIYDGTPLNGSIGFQAFADIGKKSRYDLWILKNEPSQARLEQYKKEIQNFEYQPKVSIITPVYNPDIAWIEAAIKSVINQVYSNWELCLADASTKDDVKKCLESYAMKDSRIKVKFVSENKGISGNSNEALSLATGEFIGFLDHDDEIVPLALYEVVKFLNKKPDVDFIYSDEVVITEKEGKPFYAYYRPDFSLDYMLSHQYIAHFVVIRAQLIQEINGFREEFLTSQHYDLFLRIISKTKNVSHISKVLYKWRAHESATDKKFEDRAMEFNKKAINDFLKRESIEAHVCEGLHPSYFRVKRKIVNNPKVTIIILTKDKVNYLKKCVESIEANSSYKNYEVIIVDNLSQNIETFIYLDYLQKQYSNYIVLKFTEDFNFSKINNYAVKHASGEHLLFLNNDTEIISSKWIESMLEHSQREEVGCVGAKLIYPDNKIQHVGAIIGLFGCCEHIHKFADLSDIGYMGNCISIRNCSAVTAACMMIEKKVFDEVYGFDENIKVGFGDIDLCLRVLERGYLNVFTPYAELIHYESATRGKAYGFDPHPKDTKYFINKWKKIIHDGDPYYNSNLPLNTYDVTPQFEEYSYYIHNLTLKKKDFSMKAKR